MTIPSLFKGPKIDATFSWVPSSVFCWFKVDSFLLSCKISVQPGVLQACHRMRKKDRVIRKFKCRKQKHRVLSKRKNLQNKSRDLTQFKFSGRLFVNETTCHENYQWWAWECRQLKSARKIHSIWSYNSTLHMKLVGNGLIHNTFQSMGI